MRVSLEEMLTGLDIHVIQRPMDMAMFGRTNHSLYQQSTLQTCKVISSLSTLTIMRRHTLNGTQKVIFTLR